MQHNRLKAMAIRPEKVPGLRPSTLTFIKKSVCNRDVGLASRKDFLDEENINFSDKTYKVAMSIRGATAVAMCITIIIKVSRSTGAKQQRCVLFYLTAFSEDVQTKLLKGILLV